MGRGPSWTKQEIETIGEMLRLGKSTSEIHKALPHRTYGAVSVQIGYRFGKKKPGPINTSNPRVRDYCMAQKGKKSASRIALYLGITRNAVIGHWARERSALLSREALK